MPDSPISDETLARLKREREEADALYNQALTALDRALPAGVAPPPPPDEEQLPAISGLAAIVTADPLASLSGWRRRFAGLVWRLVGPMLQRQQQFNSAVAAHLARNAAGEREARLAFERAFTSLAAFHVHLIRYLQQVTPFVESKDREAVATVHRYLADGLSALADELAKRWESMLAREQRYEARVSALSSSHADTRASIASLQQASHALKREMERVLAATDQAHVGPDFRPWALDPAHVGPGLVGPGLQPGAGALDAYKYVGFEDQFRGSVDDIRARLGEYLPCFEGASDVLDVGCGRGEFLQLLARGGVKARGIDLNHEMVETCRSQGLDVAEGDALEYLASLPDGALGGLFAAQVVEHLEPDRLIRLLDVAFSKLRPGSRIVLETINPACWAAFFDSYIRDLTHVRPVHPETLKYLLQASGFQAVDIRYLAPYPETARLQPIAMPAPEPDAPAGEWTQADLAETFNANVEKLNARLFTHRDYAAVATRL
jgi:O-antigen chain-terminating methyltransferase